MKQIDKDELFSHLGNFLKAKGIELKEGSYSQSIQKGCSILADTINLSQQGIERAKGEIDKRLEQMRQVIHEKTAPKGAKAPPPSASQAESKSQAASAAAPKKSKSAKRGPAKPAARKTAKGK